MNFAVRKAIITAQLKTTNVLKNLKANPVLSCEKIIQVILTILFSNYKTTGID